MYNIFNTVLNGGGRAAAGDGFSIIKRSSIAGAPLDN